MTSRIELDLDAFRHNVRTLAAIASPSRVMLAVKADAYGHGMLPFARAALESGADSLAVLEVPAGLALREAGITAPLFAWLHGAGTDFRAAIEAAIDLGVSSLVELDAILACGAGPANVHLKIDTGLHRNGASPEDWPALVRAARDAEEAGRVRIAALWSHLADASPEDDAAALAEFHAAVAVAARIGVTPPLLHLAASSAGIREPEARLGLVRFGIAAYGISPFDDETGTQLGLIPPMTVIADVIESDGAASVLGVGSADGIQPTGAGRAEVLLGDRRARVLEVGVDAMRVAAPARVGDEAIVFGPGTRGEPTAEDWAGWCDTIGDEVVTRASRRFPRVLLGQRDLGQ